MKKRSEGKENSNRNEESNQEMNNELHELFIDELADVYSAEQQLLKALPKMAKAANSTELQEAFESHLEETQEHVSRLEQIFKSLGETLKRKKCKAMEGLVEEGEEIMEEFEDSNALDAALIAAAQKVEHYEIATYGTLRTWAELMDHQEVVELLEETLEEEKAADEKLTGVAENVANVRAEQE
jgi:ferritin-like metal-binding protein YciE